MSRHIFLSAVTSECGKAREEIASDLRKRGLDVKEQRDFRKEEDADTTLSKLHNYIEKCSAVICIIGKRSGGFPPTAASDPFKKLLPPGIDRASYTQWEFFFARHYRRRLTICIADKTYTPDKDKPSTDDEDADSQTKFIQYVKNEQGLDRGSFSSVDGLCRIVLQEDWERIPKTRPSNLPYPSLGSLFKGREDFMTKLRESLHRTAADGRATAITGRALHGLGGVGKTRLAVEYAWLHAHEYSALLFVSGDTPQTFESNIAQLIGPLAIKLPPDVKQDVAIAAALNWLEQNPGWFLIIDNLDTPQAVLAAQRILARLKGGHVVLTSRIGQWHQYVEPLELDVLHADDAKAYLLESTAGKRRPLPTDDTDAKALAEELGSLALALEQAAAYIRKRRLSLAHYLREWQSHKPEVQAWHDPLLMPYPRSVAVTWETTLRQLGPGEIALLRLLSFFAPDPIPLWVLEHEKAPPIWQEAVTWVLDENAVASSDGTGHVSVPPSALATDWRDALALLADFSLARWNVADQTVLVHRVLQEIIRTRLPVGRRKNWLTGTLQLLNAVRPYPSYDVRTWPKWIPFQPHVTYAIVEGDSENIATPTATLMNGLGQLLHARALYSEAEPLMRRALSIDDSSYGPQHPNVARDLSNLSALLQSTNRLAEAEPLIRRALSIDEVNYGPQHPEVARDLNNLATVLKATNRLAEAEPLMRRVITIFETSLGLEHPNVASALNNLAQLLQATNRLAEAEPLMQRALSIDEVNYGPQHPNVARDLNNLAQLLQATNRLAEAEPLIRRALSIDESSYGLQHPNVARDLNNLALLLQDTNRVAEAEPLMRRALSIDESSYGLQHPNVARDLNNLALLLQDTNRVAEAEPLMRRALSIDEVNYGPQHPEVGTNLNNLATVLKATNRLAEAEPLMRRVITIFETSLGLEHPDVASALNNLAQLLQATNRLAEAEPLMQRALSIDESSYGLRHPNVAIRLNNLAQLLKATNRLAEAEPLMQRALSIDESSYGPQHPNVARDLNNLALLLKATNRLVEAEPLMRRALSIDESSYGPQHPNVARDLNNLATFLKATNRLAEAEPLMQRALSIDESSYGPQHPNVARDLNNLAQLLKATNRLAEAEPLIRRALSIDEASYGPQHPEVAIRLNNLALLLQDTNRLAEAEPLMRRAVTIFVDFTRRTGHEHPHLQTALANYASLLQAAGWKESDISAELARVLGPNPAGEP